MLSINKVKSDFVGVFDTNHDGQIEFYELYPLFLIFAMMLFFFIILKNLNILIIFNHI
jgi:hypothetical protein